MIYLDSAATTLWKPERVYAAVQRSMLTLSSPGRGGYKSAMDAAEEVYACRTACARLFHAPGAENVVFTSNASHGLNIAIHALVAPGDRVVVSGFEHNSVTRPLRERGADTVVAGTKLFDPEDTLKEFRAKLPGADAAVCTHVSNVFGYVLPIFEIADLCRRFGVPLIVDASQSAGTLEVDAQKLGAAFIAMPGHKGLFGPQGTGVLLCARPGKSLMQGGTGSDSEMQTMPDYLPDCFEAGTLNVCGIAGLRAGLSYIEEVSPAAILRKERELLEVAVSELKSCDRLELFTGENQSGVLSLRGTLDCETAAERLSAQGICVRAGLHCAPLAHASAGTLQTGTVRLSFSPFVTAEQVVTACREIQRLMI